MSSRQLFFILSTCIASCVLTAESLAQCACGPDFCQDDPRVTGTLAAKKKSLAKEYPPRLVALIEIGDQCVARITRSPDIFTMWLVGDDGSKRTLAWSQENEDRANKDPHVKRFWIYNAARAFSCCGQASYDQRPDYNATDDINTSTAILCEGGACAK